jgi:8-oxo-dGTP diphosphatase
MFRVFTLFAVLVLSAQSAEGSVFGQCKRVFSALSSLTPGHHPQNIQEAVKPKWGLVDAVAVLIIKDGKVLMTKRLGSSGAGSWAFAGGHLEANESIGETARREIEEEIGAKLKNLKWLATAYPYQPENEKRYRTFLVRAELDSDYHIAEEHKITELGWFGLEKFPQPLFEPMNQYLPEVLKVVLGLNAD